MTLPSEARLSFERTHAPPLPGLTCWNSRILKTVPSTSMWLPFLNWFVEIMSADQCRSGLPRAPGSARGVGFRGWSVLHEDRVRPLRERLPADRVGLRREVA